MSHRERYNTIRRRSRTAVTALVATTAFVGCGSVEKSTTAERAPSSSGVPAKVETDPVSATQTAEPVQTPEHTEVEVDETLQELCDAGFTYDMVSPTPGTVADLVENRWVDPGSGITQEDVISELDHATITAGPSPDTETPLEDINAELPATTSVSISFIGACDEKTH